MEIILERYFFFLDSIDSVGDVMVESRGGKEDMRLKKSYSRIYENGTQYIDAVRLQIRLTSKELKVKPKMLNIACLQLTDLIAHPSRRFMFKKYKIEEGKGYIFGDKIMEIIEGKITAEKQGLKDMELKSFHKKRKPRFLGAKAHMSFHLQINWINVNI